MLLMALGSVSPLACDGIAGDLPNGTISSFCIRQLHPSRADSILVLSLREAEYLTGVTPEELHMGSFLRILKNRTK
jgi:hypothetical protein